MQLTGYPEGHLPTPDHARSGTSVPLYEESSIMAVPKRRMSRANTRSRRAQWKAKRPELVNVTVAGQQHKVPRRLLKAARLGLIDLDRG
jgi:large subunit ribosomal protein L32